MSGGLTPRLDDPRPRRPPPVRDDDGRRGGLALVLFSAACFATLGVLAQLAHRAGVSIATLVSARFVLAAAVFWAVVRVSGRPLPRRRETLLALALGVAYSADTTLLFASLTETKAALVDLLFFTYPALVAVGAFVLRRERWSGRRAAGIGAALIGTAMVVGGDAGGLTSGGAALALGAAALYAGYILVAASLLRRVDAIVLVALVTSGAGIAATVGGAALGRLQPALGARAILLVAAIALVSTVLGIGSFVAGVARLGPSRASIVSSVQPALTAILAFLIFRDRLAPLQLLGGALVLGTIVILERRPRLRASLTQATARLTQAAADPATAYHLQPTPAIVVRLNHADDRPALKRLARLESKPLPPEPLVVAEVEGQILAATTLNNPSTPLSDPRRRTAHLLELLELRAAQIRNPHRQPLPTLIANPTPTQ